MPEQQARNEQFLWRTSSTHHNWNDQRFVSKLLTRATDLGLLGPVTWRQQGYKGKPKPAALPNASALLHDLPEPGPKEPPNAYVEAGGEEPYPWTAILSIAHLEGEENTGRDMSMIWLFFNEQAVRDRESSQELMSAFMDTHGPDNTEYAFIHPYQHSADFADRHYRPPVTIGTMFKGVLWANFLGPGHIGEFDSEKLAAISAYKTKWVDHNGFFLIAGEDIRKADDTSAEEEYLRLTRLFRDAVRPDSKWR